MSKENQEKSLWKVLVKRPRETKIIKENLTREDAVAERDGWEKIFTPENYHEPVPKVLLKRMGELDSED